MKSEFSKCFSKSSIVIICPLYAAGEKRNPRFDVIKLAKSISNNSNTQVILANNEMELKNYFKKNLMSNEIIIGMGAGKISKWIAGLKNSI